MEQLQILIADDSEFMRIAYKRILESQSNFRVVAMASNGEEAVQKAAETAPDVAILDIRMPKVDGIKVAHQFSGDLGVVAGVGEICAVSRSEVAHR